MDEVTYRFRERFHSDAVMDCVSALYISDAVPNGESGVAYLETTTRRATQFSNGRAHVTLGNWYMGEYGVSSFGRPKLEFGGDLDYPATGLFAQIGLPFTTRVVPWNRRSVNTQRGVREVKRTVMLFVTVQQTSLFEVEGRPFGGYFTGDDVSEEPPLRDMQVSMVLLGTDDYVDYEIVRSIPGKFRLLKIGYWVTV